MPGTEACNANSRLKFYETLQKPIVWVAFLSNAERLLPFMIVETRRTV